MKNKLILFLLIGPIIGLGAGLLQAYYYLAIWQHSKDEVIFEIRPGENFAQINHRLYQEKLISSPRLFHHYAQWLNCLHKFRAGNFKIEENLNMQQIMNTLLYARPYYVKVTIPEGKNLYEIAQTLAKLKIVDSAEEFIEAAKKPVDFKQLALQLPTAEGLLYPETYFFSPNSPPAIIIHAMIEQFTKSTKDLDWAQSPLDLPQLITLASIVEKETGAKGERAKIAGVFFNRLRKNMRLQSDPTTIYGIFEHYNGNLTKKDLEEKTPYNTYRINGLPRGPICNPGVAAITAALAPEQHKFLYFVSKNDGTHIFSQTYGEHNAAVENFQKNSAARQNKSWRNLSQ